MFVLNSKIVQLFLPKRQPTLWSCLMSQYWWWSKAIDDIHFWDVMNSTTLYRWLMQWVMSSKISAWRVESFKLKITLSLIYELHILYPIGKQKSLTRMENLVQISYIQGYMSSKGKLLLEHIKHVMDSQGVYIPPPQQLTSTGRKADRLQDEVVYYKNHLLYARRTANLNIIYLTILEIILLLKSLLLCFQIVNLFVFRILYSK